MPITLSDTSLKNWLSEQIAKTQITPDSLVFEITEPIAELQPHDVSRFINDIHSLGCSCSLERCGRNADFLGMLHDLPVDYVKLDPILIRDLLGSTSKRRTMREYFKNLLRQLQEGGTDTIVTGIEDAQSLSLLWSYNVNYVQGYFLQRPHEHMLYDFAATA